MKKISVLVPICNVEKYLDECLSSLVGQTLNNIEIICINDGSTDGSLKIIKKYASKDNRIVVIDKKNTGYGDSMNLGIKKATGEYIAIVESDDYIDKDAFSELYELGKKHKADIVRANYYYHSKEGDKIHQSIRDQKLLQWQSLADDFAILNEEPAIWSAIYRRDFLNEANIRFLPTPGASYQDTSFNIKALCSAQKIIYTDKAYLHYRTDNSNSSVKSLEKADYVLGEFAEVERYLEEKRVAYDIKCAVQISKFGSYHWNLIRLPKKLRPAFLKKVKADFANAKERDLLDKKRFPKKYWLALQIILHFPVGFYCWLLSLRNP